MILCILKLCQSCQNKNLMQVPPISCKIIQIYAFLYLIYFIFDETFRSVYNLNTEQVTLVISFEIKLTNLKVYTKLKKFCQQISSKALKILL